jgi:DNA repair exonuclease SbcCD ATPase subunit
VKLLRLSLRNFKGVRELTVAPAGKTLTVSGDNATGKTTLADAFCWVLFGKDSSGRADFEIKTLTPSGEPHHGLDHEVEAELELPSGARTTFRRVYRETWTKRRGEARREFTGHTTEYSVDGVPSKKQEYDAAVAAIAPEETFRLLTDPLQFAERLHWQDRRRILLEVCGDVPDADVIASSVDLAGLAEVLGKRGVEDLRKVLAARKAEINRQLERIPVRIDEVTRSQPALPEQPETALLAALAAKRAARAEAEAERQRAEAGGELAEKTKRLREVEAETLSTQTAARDAAERAAEGLRSAVRAAQDEVAAARLEEAGARAALLDARAETERLSVRMAERRAAWSAVNAETFAHAEADTCAACGQPLPAEKVEAARARALEQFNADRARRLSTIDTEGKALKLQHDELAACEAARDSAVAAGQVRVEQGEAAVAAAQGRFEEARRVAPGGGDAEALAALLASKERIEAEIDALKAGRAESVADAAGRIAGLDREIEGAEAVLARFEQHRRGVARTEELKAEEARLAAEFEEVERQLFMTEEFVRAKVRLVEERINARFKLARFKLFEQQVNTARREVCEVTYGGVPYSAGLNHGARVAVGLDIIRSLQSHYGFAPPVWVDQAESFTTLPPMDCQVIRLVVSAGDKQLRIEEERGDE